MKRSHKQNMALSLIIVLVFTLAFASLCMAEEVTAPAPETNPEIIILYTNDIHTYINNETTDDDGNTTRGLSYANVAAMKNELEAEGKIVYLVDAGDHVQGTAYGSMDEGEHIIQLMNAVGYDVSTLGNHEFDYGMFTIFNRMEEAEFEYLSCNFYSVESGKNVLPATVVFEVNGVRVGFVGISTPESITASTPVYFQDEEGNFIYNFYAGTDGQELYDCVQAAVDQIRDNVDYCIAVGHLGAEPRSAPYRSQDVIANTTGIDAFIDGHSHTVMEGKEVTNKDGEEVLLTQTGCYFGNIGKMTLSENGITTELINEYENVDEAIDRMQNEWIDSVDDLLGQKIAVNETDFTINDPADGSRLVRRGETNLADLNADAIYSYFNDIEDLSCDIAIQNGGGVRSDLSAGDISYMDVKTVNPFGNVICMVNVKGQDIIEALEKGAYAVGTIDEETGEPLQYGGFLQVAGLKYDIDTSITSTIEMDENGCWISGPSGEYRVKNVQAYNKETGSYEDIDPEATYSVGGSNYILRNGGNGFTMFKDSELIKDYVGEDYMIFSAYLMSFDKDEDGFAKINTVNSPLAKYQGYLLDYENPYGSGRITIKLGE